MKTLKTIQKLSKIAKVLCKIIFILSIVGGALSIVGIIGLAVVPEGFKIGGVTIHSMIEKSAEISMPVMYAQLASGVVICAAEAVLCRIAGNYFKHELDAGTPFTFDGAKEMKRLGICTICIPVGAQILSAIIGAIILAAFGSLGSIENMTAMGCTSVGLGIMFIIAGLICRHGAEISQSVPPVEKAE